MRQIIAAFLIFDTSAFAGGEYWIGPNPTPVPPNIQSAFAIGSQNNPYNGSSGGFDIAVNLIPAFSHIHILPGTYDTMGVLGCFPKSGQRFTGAGEGLTILQFPAKSVASGACNDAWVFEPGRGATNVILEDVSINGNYQAGTFTTLNGVNLHGANNAALNVEVYGLASYTSAVNGHTNYVESFSILFDSTGFPDAINNRVEGCYIHGYRCNFGNDNYGIGMAQNNSGLILNNLITQDGNNWQFGIGPGSHDSVVAFNTMVGCVEGTHCDSAFGWTNIIYVHNIMSRVCTGFDLANANFSDSMIADNELTITNNGGGYWPMGAFRTNYPAPSAYNNLIVTGNMVRSLVK